jgi:hypothetical protein
MPARISIEAKGHLVSRIAIAVARYGNRRTEVAVQDGSVVAARCDALGKIKRLTMIF